MNKSKLDSFEKVAKLLKDNCFEKFAEDHFFYADYEVRSLEVFVFQGESFLSIGDKRGRLKVYNRLTEELIIDELVNGTIDILSFVNLPGDRGLLFVGVRFQGLFVYRFDSDIKSGNLSQIIEENKFISFFYPNIAFDSRGNAKKFELWVCFQDGDFRICTNNYPIEDWNQRKQENLPYVIESCTVDYNERSGITALFLGNSAGDIFYIPFSEREGADFPKNLKALNKRKILNIHGAVIENMIPLSSYRTMHSDKSPGEPFYRDYSGCLVSTNNKVICIYFVGARNLPKDVRTLTKVFPTQVIDIKCLQFNDCCYTVASDVEKKLHMVKNITDMEPSSKNIEVIFDGEYRNLTFDESIYKFCFVPFQDEIGGNRIEQRAYLGTGNYAIPINIYFPGSKLKEAENFFSDLLEIRSGTLSQSRKGIIDKREVFDLIEEILDHFRLSSSKTAIKQLLLRLLGQFAQRYCKSEQSFLLNHKDRFCRIFYKIIENEDSELVIKASEFLAFIEKHCSRSPEVITDLQIHIKKFILNKKSYSLRSEKLKELVEYNENCGNLVDAVIYRGILCERQYDPVSHIEFNDDDGEITRIVSFANKFIASTSKGKVFYVDMDDQEKRLIFEHGNDRKTGNLDTKINNIYSGREKVYLLARDKRIIVLDAQKIQKKLDKNIPFPSKEVVDITILLPGNRSYGMAVCRMPHAAS